MPRRPKDISVSVPAPPTRKERFDEEKRLKDKKRAIALDPRPEQMLDPYKVTVSTTSKPYINGKNPAKETSAYIREFLHSYPPTELTRETVDMEMKSGVRQTYFDRMLKAMIKTASSSSHPASVSAFEAIMNRAYGRPKPSEEELGAIEKGGFQLVYIARPENDPDIPEAVEPKKPEPKFLEGEVVDE